MRSSLPLPLLVALVATVGCKDDPTDTAPTDECAPLALQVRQELDPSDFLPSNPPDFGNLGLALGDLDGDGDLDLVVASYDPHSRILWNEGGTFEPGPTLPAATGVAIVDVTGDGVLDIHLVVPYDADRLMTGQGEQWTETALVPSEAEGFTPSWADIDGDGDLDVFVAAHNSEASLESLLDGSAQGTGNALFRNDGGTLVDISDQLPAEVITDISFLGQWVDDDLDGDLDLYLANDFGPWAAPNRLLRNDGSGTFTLATDCLCDRAMFAMGAAVGDPTGDGRPDLIISNIAGPVLFSTEGGEAWIDRSAAMGVSIPGTSEQLAGWGSVFVDLNGDGRDDVPMVFGQVVPGSEPGQSVDALDPGFEDGPNQNDAVLLATSEGFREAGAELGFDDDRIGRSLVSGDLDGDGRPELISAGIWYATVWESSGGCGPGVTVALEASDIGSRVDATVNGEQVSRWLLPAGPWSQSALELSIGVGTEGQAEDVRVVALDGSERLLGSASAGERLGP